MTAHATRTHATKSAAIRATLDHPVIDADGHALEFGPVFFDYLKQVAGPAVTQRYQKKIDTGGWYSLTPDERVRRHAIRPSSWTHPTKNTLDRATAMLPRLFRSRMDDFGLDFSIVYGTIALATLLEPDEEMRRATCRALNVMYADNFRDQSDRMTPVATIPAHTPQEAIEELDYAVGTLGLRAVLVGALVKRPVPIVAEEAPHLASYATWLDTLCMNSPHDYDPLWAKCVALKVAVTAHSPSIGSGGRVALNHYIHNHVGSFAAAGEAFAKALVLSGVTKRFPTLNFGFLEGGVAWASELYAGLAGHCGKRNSVAAQNYDPKAIDMGLLTKLFAEYGQPNIDQRMDTSDPRWWRSIIARHGLEDGSIAHELDNLGITCAEDLRPLFEPHFYFGCEADDPLVALGFDQRFNPFGARLKATFSSDIGHWDVPDMNEVLEEAYELVEHGLLNKDDFREFTFVNPATLHAGMNPDFFKGTVVEDAVAKLLAR